MGHFTFFLGILVLLIASVFAQFPPPPQDVKIVTSKLGSGVTISYKETQICETTPGVKAYSGYVHLPPKTVTQLGNQNYPINLFFWYFSARKNPTSAPLALWLHGYPTMYSGPVPSSLRALFSGNGPCTVNADSSTTTLNPNSWNNEANLLYVDQPVQAGFSYDELLNVTRDLFSGGLTVVQPGTVEPKVNSWNMTVGTIASQKTFQTANTTTNAAHVFWHFAQHWLSNFPEYKTSNKKIALWTQENGARFAATYTRYIRQKNHDLTTLARNTTSKAIAINVDTVGIVNGCLDMEIETPISPEMAYKNTYGIQAIPDYTYTGVLAAMKKPAGCNELMARCRALAEKDDPDNTGNVDAVSSACGTALDTCSIVKSSFDSGGFMSGTPALSQTDIAHKRPETFPPPYYIGYLNQRSVQVALGVPKNFTNSVSAVAAAFAYVSEQPTAGPLRDLGTILNDGVQVAMVYGDRDYACNWMGGEAISRAVSYTGASGFRAAGYHEMKTNATYVGGYTRQFGGFSFTRVLDAGQDVYAYQPETALTIFNRAMAGLTIATGGSNGTVAGKGMESTLSIKNKAPPSPKSFCYVLERRTCSSAQQQAIDEGWAVVKNYIMVGVTKDAPAHLQPKSGSG